MKTLTLLLLISFSTFAQNSRPSMSPVLSTSPQRVQKLASGVCSLGTDETGSACCTGFRIAQNKIMTNFHCLACANKVFKKIVGATPFMMEPSVYLYSLGKSPLSKREEIIKRVNMDPELGVYNLTANDIPKNNDELKGLLNSIPNEMTHINFETYLGNTNLEESAFRILSVEDANDKLDYAILNIEAVSDDHHVFSLKDTPLKRSQELGIIGHPHGGPNPDKKSFDITPSCAIDSPVFHSANRNSVFSHKCDTLPGNSGSPLIERSSGEVIGIHWGKNESSNVNLGIDMSAIINDISF